MELNKDYTKILGTDNASTIDDTNSTQIDEIEADMTTIEESVTTLETNNTGTNTGDNSANTTYADDYRVANFVADTDYQSVPSEGAFEDGDKSKLDGIEEGADVTDAGNVNAVESDPIVGAVTGIVKADGAGAISSASAGTDYQSPLTADTDYLTPGTAGTTYEPLKGDDDNYVTDAEKTVIGNTSNTNSGDQSASDFNHDDLANITGTASQYNHPTDAQMTVLGNTSNTNTGDQTISDETITTTDVTTNDMSTSKHGFAPKGSGVAGQFLNSSGSWSAPSGSGDTLAPATNTDNYIPQWDGTDSKTLKDGYSVVGLLSLLNPIGTIREFSVSTNPATLLGFGTWTAHGTGRVTIAIDSGDVDFDTVDETGGAKTHTLSEAELPSHDHTVNPPSTNTDNDTHNHSTGGSNVGGTTSNLFVGGSGGGYTPTGVVGSVTVGNDTHNHAVDIAQFDSGTAGSGDAHNNVQPYIVVYRWVRTA